MYMKYNWPAAIKELKKVVLEHTTIFVGRETKPSRAWMEHLRFTMVETDQFHPYGCDGELSRALNRMPEGRCNYRSVESYWAFKFGRDDLEEALYSLISEMGCAIEEYYAEPHNFPPGASMPDRVVTTTEDVANKLSYARLVSRILKAAKY